MTDHVAQVEALHEEYQRLTGERVTLLGRDVYWSQWIRRGLTMDDLRALVAEKKRRIADGWGTRAGLQFRRLIGDLDAAEEECSTLRALARTKKPDPDRAAVLRATGRPASEANSNPAKPAREVVAKLQGDPAKLQAALAELQRMKNSL